jgi:hypothetical protein
MNPRPRRENLRAAWKKGVSGNPRGSSKRARERATWKERLADEDPEILEVLVGIVRGRRPASGASASITRVPIGERRRAAEFLFTHLHGQPKQTVESEWPAHVTIHVNPSDVGPGRKE